MKALKLKKLKTMEMYELLEKQMIILIFFFGILSALCGYLAYYFGQKKSIAASREVKWTDEHKYVAAVRFQFHDMGGKDLAFFICNSTF